MRTDWPLAWGEVCSPGRLDGNRAPKHGQNPGPAKVRSGVLGGVERCLENSCGLFLLPAVLEPILRVLPIFLGLGTKAGPSWQQEAGAYGFLEASSLPLHP